MQLKKGAIMIDGLLKERERLLKTLPKFDEILRGTAFERFVKCGNKNCHCATGKGHQVFCVGATHSKTKTEQITVPEELFLEAKNQISNYDLSIQILNKVSDINRKILRKNRDKQKDIKRDKNAKRN